MSSRVYSHSKPRPLSMTPIRSRSVSFSDPVRPSSIHVIDDKSTHGWKRNAFEKFLSKVGLKSNNTQPSEVKAEFPSGDQASTVVESSATSTGTGHLLQSCIVLPLAIAGQDPPMQYDSSIHRSSRSTSMSVDELSNAIRTAEASVGRMETASIFLGITAEALKTGGGWIPLVGEGVKTIADILVITKKVGDARITTLVFVKRCADIMECILDVMREEGRLSPSIIRGVMRLHIRISQTASLLYRHISGRHFLKLLARAGDLKDQIAQATLDIAALFHSFQFRAACANNRELVQARNDREAGEKAMNDKTEEQVQDETVISLVAKAEEEQQNSRAHLKTLEDQLAQQLPSTDPIHSPGRSTLSNPLGLVVSVEAGEGGTPNQSTDSTPTPSTTPPNMASGILPETVNKIVSSTTPAVPSLSSCPSSVSLSYHNPAYKRYLRHPFDPRLTVPLFHPREVSLGSVGYICDDQFIPLLDATKPPSKFMEQPPVARLDLISPTLIKRSLVNARNETDKGWAKRTLHAAMKNLGKEKVCPPVSEFEYHLVPGGAHGILVVEDAEFAIYNSTTAAKNYLIGNIDWIVKHYGENKIKREDVIIVVGTLSATNYAMAVAQCCCSAMPCKCPTTVKFKGYTESEMKTGFKWGRWEIDEDEGNLKFFERVSNASTGPKPAVLLAKLKFGPGGVEPNFYD